MKTKKSILSLLAFTGILLTSSSSCNSDNTLGYTGADTNDPCSELFDNEISLLASDSWVGEFLNVNMTQCNPTIFNYNDVPDQTKLLSVWKIRYRSNSKPKYIFVYTSAENDFDAERTYNYSRESFGYAITNCDGSHLTGSARSANYMETFLDKVEEAYKYPPYVTGRLEADAEAFWYLEKEYNVGPCPEF